MGLKARNRRAQRFGKGENEKAIEAKEALKGTQGVRFEPAVISEPYFRNQK